VVICVETVGFFGVRSFVSSALGVFIHTYYIRAQLDVLVGFRTISHETYHSWLGTFLRFFFLVFFFFGLLSALFSLCGQSELSIHVCSVSGTKRAGSCVRRVVFLRAVSRCCTVLVFGSSMLYTPLGAEMAGLMFQEVEYVDIV
jgi:hypothetical protein